MRTPGHDEELALGFLHGEGLIDGPRAAGPPADLAANIVEVEGAARCASPAAALLHDLVVRRLRQGRAGGGRGARAAPAAPGPQVERALLADLPERLTQPAFERTGGLHATGLFDAAGELLCAREDVGRHNAMDKVIGRALLDGAVPLTGMLLCVSGRLAFELVQKAAVAGVPDPRRRRRPDLARGRARARAGMTLCGFARDGRVNVYSGAERVS